MASLSKKASVANLGAPKKGGKAVTIDQAELRDLVDFTNLEDFDLSQGARFLLRNGELRSVTVDVPPYHSALAKLKDLNSIEGIAATPDIPVPQSPSSKGESKDAGLNKGEKHRGGVQLLLFSDILFCYKAGKGPAKTKTGAPKGVPVGFPILLKSMVLQETPSNVHDHALKFDVRFGESFHYTFKCSSEADKKEWIAAIFGVVDWLKSVYRWTLSAPSKKHTEVRVAETAFPKTKWVPEGDAEADADLSSFQHSEGDSSVESSSVYSAVSAAMSEAAANSAASAASGRHNSTEDAALSNESSSNSLAASAAAAAAAAASAAPGSPEPHVSEESGSDTMKRQNVKRHLSESTLVTYRAANGATVKDPAAPASGGAHAVISGRRGSTFYMSMSKRMRDKKQEASVIFGDQVNPVDEEMLAAQITDPFLAAATQDPNVRTVYVYENGKQVMVLQSTEGSVLAPTVLAGLPTNLVERLADENELEPGYVDVVLLTYRQYMEPMDLFDMLVGRFNILPEENPTAEDMQYYQKWKRPIQTKVLKVLLEWTQHHWPDFKDNTRLYQALHDFVPEILHSGYTIAYKYIKDTLDKNDADWEKTLASAEALNTERKVKVLDSIVTQLEAKDLAEQMTLFDSGLYQNIHPLEFVHQLWTPKDRERTQYAPFLSNFILRFDTESFWVASEIVYGGRDAKSQADLIAKFIMVAKHCLALNNFYSVFSVMGGLHFPVIRKLKAAWDLLPAAVIKAKERIEQIMNPSRNMRAYREAIANIKPNEPVLPFLPVYLKDLVFINDGNPRLVNEMVNFDKLRMISKIIYKMYDYGRDQYKTLEPKHHVQNYLQNARIIRDLPTLNKQMKMPLA
ncbi:hypothetical protein CAOG_00173 [Capsaspora owczarzaki ATCC 30864]|uniref:hypothetical protein n=1 Tax=Capsaspora owczarzaki (strain ATCC 30864) TaxID=595528 RepID=UPI0001FE68A6|nr:hypothetical protein CAOG_00173 [Capsaspora owczarzaki ATCC 30864]|eukprot:XP_004365044.1 hypothetical protein CAOG_00173 [Capsaspora owczarzaki ATCC 30864]